jgi:transcriptional regulator with XRE-family HTH domain
MEKKDFNNHIGKVVQEYRLKNNLTQNQVAELTGLEPRHISQIERGFSKGSIDTLIKLCNAFHITPDIILYDLLDKEVKNSISIYDEKFKKLSKRDKESILHFIDYFLDN